MIYLNLLRENPEAIKVSQRVRGRDEGLVDQAVEADAQHRKALSEFESLCAEQNAHAKLVSTAPKASFLSSYPIVDKQQTAPSGNNSNGKCAHATRWLSVIRGSLNA